MTHVPTARLPRHRAHAPGPEGNRQLTASVGTVLLILLAVQGVTILSLTQLLPVHFFVGMLLIGPVTLKIGTTGYRAYRYYRGDPTYRRLGAPHPALRLLGPLQIAATVALLATGCTLALLGRGGMAHQVLFLHKATFILWCGLTAIHVLAHVLHLPTLVGADLRRRTRTSGRALRWILIAASLATGALIATAGLHLVSGWR